MPLNRTGNAFYSAVIQGMSAKARAGSTRGELDSTAAIALRVWP
jgi:hypothetical protein